MIHKKEGTLVLSFLCPCRAGKIPVASQALDFDFTIKKTKPAHKEKNLCMCRFSLAAKKNTGVSAPDCTQAASAAVFCRGNSAAIPPMD